MEAASRARRRLALFAQPVRLSRQHYLDPRVFEEEQEKIFRSCWLYAGLRSDFSGTPRTVSTAGLTISIAQDGGTLHAIEGRRHIRVATAGELVFFSLSDRERPSLDEYLSPFFGELASMTARISEADHHGSVRIDANWKILVENTLDDYHPATVHSTTLYPSMITNGARRTTLRRHGWHSLLDNELSDADQVHWSKIDQRLKLRRFSAKPDYRHLFIFPNFYVGSFFGALAILHRINPLDEGASMLRWDLCLPVGEPCSGARDALRRSLVGNFASKAHRVISEDIAVCEAVQRGQHYTVHAGLLGGGEVRIGDFQKGVLTALEWHSGPTAGAPEQNKVNASSR